jgi:hypothetical protein
MSLTYGDELRVLLVEPPLVLLHAGDAVLAACGYDS